jgi:mlo protein
MGSCYKKEIFNEHVQQGVLGWAQKVKMKRGLKGTGGLKSNADSAGPSVKIEMATTMAPAGDREAVGNIE